MFQFPVDRNTTVRACFAYSSQLTLYTVVSFYQQSERKLTTMSVSKASEINDSGFEMLTQTECSNDPVNGLRQEIVQKRTEACGLSSTTTRYLEVSILTLVIVCVIVILSLPSAIYFARQVSLRHDQIRTSTLSLCL